MALTPEDVVNKRFQPTKFREGYDQDEVDDFLDEVVVELRRLNQENEELRQRLVASDSRINELQRSAAQAPPAPAFAQQAAPQEAFPAPVPAPAPTPAPVEAPVAAPAAAPAAAAFPADAGDPNNTNNLLQLARRLHEEHVREGVEKRDALIAEGQAAAARSIQEAQEAQRTQVSALVEEREQLEKSIEELRTFERDYRQKLKGYIEGQLRELDSATNLVSAPAGAPAPAAAAFAAPEAAAPQAAAPNYQGFGGAN